jgi:hypothetical protein
VPPKTVFWLRRELDSRAYPSLRYIAFMSSGLLLTFPPLPRLSQSVTLGGQLAAERERYRAIQSISPRRLLPVASPLNRSSNTTS